MSTSSSTPPYSPLNGHSASPNQSLTSPLSPISSDAQVEESAISPVEGSQSSPPMISSSSAKSGGRSTRAYTVASHSVRITKQGYATDPVRIQYSEVINNLSEESRRRSDASFDKSQVEHKILELIRGFWSQSSTRVSWIPKDKKRLFKQICNLCHKLEDVFSNEPRVLHLESPCIVMGDIHGNLNDLRTYERSLWPKAPHCTTNSYLFLGDYVDRGDYSIECVLYLFSMKLISRHRFYLLRGNHEVAALQLQYTFCRECEVKFGPTLGRKLWRVFNKVFDVLPLAALIDNQIFCAHGGIPRSVTEVSLLSSIIPTPLENPEHQCAAAWEILWNDPITDSELIGMIEMDNVVAKTSIAANQSPSSSSFVSHNSDPVDTGQNGSSPATQGQPSTRTNEGETNSKGAHANSSDINKPKGVTRVIIAQPIASTTSKIIEAPSSPSIVTPITRNHILAESTGAHPLPSSSSSSSSSTTAAGTGTTNDSNQRDDASHTASDVTRSLNGSDSILAREAASPLSFYIRPDTQQPVEEPAAGSAAKVVSRSKQKETTNDKSANSDNNRDNDKPGDDQRLRSVPSDTSSIASTSPQELINDGFVHNIKRGTAYLFSDQAINNFLNANKLTHVIRAHEVIPTGFAFHGDGRVITIFSSSKYCGLNNQAACALVDNNCIRILRLDTGDAGE